MKTIITLILSIVLAGSTQAQELRKIIGQNGETSVKMARKKFIESLTPANKNRHNVSTTPRHFKSAEDFKTIQLDSSKHEIFDPSDGSVFIGDKTIFTYTENQKEASETTLLLDPFSSTYFYSDKLVKTYDDKSNLIRNSHYLYENDTKNWYESGRQEYVYDDQGNLTRETHYYTVDQNTLVPDSKYQYAYDKSTNVKQTILFYWDSGSNTWSSILKEEDKYDSLNNLQQILASGYDQSSHAWIQFARILYEQEDSVTNNELAYLWNDSTSDWMILLKLQTKTDAFGDTLSIAGYDWIEADSTWAITDIETYTYNEHHLKTSDVYIYLEDTDSTWQRTDSLVYGYDDNGNFTGQQDFTWDDLQSEYVAISKTERKYDLTSDGKIILLPENTQSFVIRQSPNKLLSEMNFQVDESGLSWIQADNREFYYSNFQPTGIKETKNAEGIGFYPNPVHEQLNVTNTSNLQGQINILDLNGRELMTGQLNKTTSFNMGYLHPGVYILQVVDNGQILYTEKFVKL